MVYVTSGALERIELCPHHFFKKRTDVAAAVCELKYSNVADLILYIEYTGRICSHTACSDT